MAIFFKNLNFLPQKTTLCGTFGVVRNRTSNHFEQYSKWFDRTTSNMKVVRSGSKSNFEPLSNIVRSGSKSKSNHFEHCSKWFDRTTSNIVRSGSISNVRFRTTPNGPTPNGTWARNQGWKCPKSDLAPKNTKKSKLSTLGHFDMCGIRANFWSQIFFEFFNFDSLWTCFDTFFKVDGQKNWEGENG